jgi:simple sugar transport system permease protein
MKRYVRAYLGRPEVVAFVVLSALILFFAVRSEGLFISPANLRGILSLWPELAILSLGFALLMIAGEFDLSIGSMFGFMPMVVAVLVSDGVPFWVAFAAGCLVCVAVGLINGTVTLWFGIPSFITTLGMLFMLRSLSVVVYTIGSAPGLPPEAPRWAFSAPIGDVRVSLLWLLFLSGSLYFLLERTNFGNWIRATGAAPESAQAMGIPVRAVKMTCFVICSLLAGLAGLIQVMRIGSPLPSFGDGLELQAIAAAVIGGVALTGGIGSVLGAVVGMAIIRIIDAGMIISRVDANWFKFAIGALTVLAVVLNAWLGRRAKRIKVHPAG